MAETVFRFLEETGTRHANMAAVIDRDHRVTFGALLDASLTLRRALARQLGPERSIVGFMCSNGPDFISGLFALIGEGKVAAPLAPQPRWEESSDAANGLHMTHIVAHRDFCEHLPPTWTAALLEDSPFVLITRSARDSGEASAASVDHVPNAAVIRPTSGTTGRSKGVILSHETIAERTAAGLAALRLEPGERVCWVLPMAYHFVVSVILYVRYAIPIALVRDQLGESILQTLRDAECAMLYGTPLHYSLLAQTPSSQRFPALRLPISTTSPLSPAIADRFADRFHLPVSQVYGIIELGLPLGNIGGAGFTSHSVGTPSPGFEAKIIHDTQPITRSGESGDLLLRGPGMFDGYLEPRARRSDMTSDGWFATGDIAYYGTGGEIFIAGRKKSVIITAGNKVFPEEVEGVLDTYPGVRRCRVFGKSHDLLGEIVTAEVELDQPETFDREEIIRFCKRRMTNFKVPQELHLSRAIRTTPTGKVARSS